MLWISGKANVLFLTAFEGCVWKGKQSPESPPKNQNGNIITMKLERNFHLFNNVQHKTDAGLRAEQV